ncbi:MAG: hypothetical protein PUG10_01025 [Lachnospiraceae bacterium]|nr:hypothetical protein [Lachnospiraceae bacterium]
MAKNKLLVLFPGRNYSVDKPLLYYAAKVFEKRGYEVIGLNYNFYLKGNKNDIAGLIEEAKQYVVNQLKNVDFSRYEDIVFVSKSMGTALAGYYETLKHIRVRHIFLTPVPEGMKYMQRGKCIVVAGKEDTFLDAQKLKIYCVEQEVSLKQFEEVGHSLEHNEDMNITFAILMVIIRMYREF